MPVFLRRFYLKQVEKALEAKAKAMQDASTGKSSGTNISRPGIVPK
jgi:hypothetical protein